MIENEKPRVAEFTSGPWFVNHYGIHNNKVDVATVNAGLENANANTRLIMASPTLYRACKVALYAFDSNNFSKRAAALELLRKAIDIVEAQ